MRRFFIRKSSCHRELRLSLFRPMTLAAYKCRYRDDLQLDATRRGSNRRVRVEGKKAPWARRVFCPTDLPQRHDLSMRSFFTLSRSADARKCQGWRPLRPRKRGSAPRVATSSVSRLSFFQHFAPALDFLKRNLRFRFDFCIKYLRYLLIETMPLSAIECRLFYD